MIPFESTPSRIVEPVRPAVLDRAVQLMWVAAAISIITGVLGLVLGDPEGLLPYDPTLGVTREGQVRMAYTIGGLGVVLNLGLWAWMAIKVRQGRQWARVLSTVFYGLAALGFLGGLVTVISTGSGVGQFIASFVITALSTYILVLIWHRDVTRYVTEDSLYRAQIQYRVSQMRGY